MLQAEYPSACNLHLMGNFDIKKTMRCATSICYFAQMRYACCAHNKQKVRARKSEIHYETDEMKLELYEVVHGPTYQIVELYYLLVCEWSTDGPDPRRIVNLRNMI